MLENIIIYKFLFKANFFLAFETIIKAQINYLLINNEKSSFPNQIKLNKRPHTEKKMEKLR